MIFDPSPLPSIINIICEDRIRVHFDDVLSILKSLPTNKRPLMENVIAVVKIMLVNVMQCV